jgi:hypothetical protein
MLAGASQEQLKWRLGKKVNSYSIPCRFPDIRPNRKKGNLMKNALTAATILCVAFCLSSMAAAQTASAPVQNAPATKPCLAFASDNSSIAHFSRDALQAAVTPSGDLDFYPSEHPGCWKVHEISATLGTTPQGYAISWVVTDLHDLYVAHGLNLGQQDAFTKAMQAAAAAARKDIGTQTSH